MTTNHDLVVPEPPRIAALEHDSRGYPLPYILQTDEDGTPNFAVNDMWKVWSAVKQNLCHVCGQELDEHPWFVGGAGSALLNGDVAVYTDGPLHHDCMQYAMQVCPHLAHRMKKALAPAMLKRMEERGMIDPREVSEQPALTREDRTGIAWDPTQIGGIPEVFVAVRAWKVKVTQVGPEPHWLVSRPVLKTEYWRAGKLMSRQEGERLAKSEARSLSAQLRRPVIH